MPIDPSKPSGLDRMQAAQNAVSKVSSSVSLITGVAFIAIGVGALIAAPITSQLMLLPIGIFAILFGAVRLWLYRRGR